MPSLLSILLFSLLAEEERRRTQIADAPFINRISAIARRRRDRRIPRFALQSSNESPFVTLFMSANDQALITMTGFDHSCFHYILHRFAPLYALYSPYSESGMVRRLRLPARRPRSLNALQCLGLVLAWGRTRGSIMVLCMLFGTTASVCSVFLRFGRRLLIRALRDDAYGAVKLPTESPEMR